MFKLLIKNLVMRVYYPLSKVAETTFYSVRLLFCIILV